VSFQFGDELEELYGRSDFTGRVVRQLMAAPGHHQQIVKSYGTPRVLEKRLPPRVCLRPLAHQQVLAAFQEIPTLNQYQWHKKAVLVT